MGNRTGFCISEAPPSRVTQAGRPALSPVLSSDLHHYAGLYHIARLFSVPAQSSAPFQSAHLPVRPSVSSGGARASPASPFCSSFTQDCVVIESARQSWRDQSLRFRQASPRKRLHYRAEPEPAGRALAEPWPNPVREVGSSGRRKAGKQASRTGPTAHGPLRACSTLSRSGWWSQTNIGHS